MYCTALPYTLVLIVPALFSYATHTVPHLLRTWWMMTHLTVWLFSTSLHTIGLCCTIELSNVHLSLQCTANPTIISLSIYCNCWWTDLVPCCALTFSVTRERAALLFWLTFCANAQETWSSNLLSHYSFIKTLASWAVIVNKMPAIHNPTKNPSFKAT